MFYVLFQERLFNLLTIKYLYVFLRTTIYLAFRILRSRFS